MLLSVYYAIIHEVQKYRKNSKNSKNSKDSIVKSHAYIKLPSHHKSGSLKVKRLHKGKKNNTISCFIRSLVLNTLIFIDASAT